MENEMVTIDQPMTALQVRTQVNLIQEVMKGVMKEDQHFGKIPGCGNKPTLLKPGAEKLSMTFRLRPIIDNTSDIRITDLGEGHREIQIYCHITSMAGVELATGVGSCSTMESKYRYRGGEKKPTGKAVPKEYWNLKKEGNTGEAQALIGGRGFGTAKINGSWEICELGDKMENVDIADTYNTVLKMAKKRAFVDGILSATSASDIFTQDIEDFPTNMKTGAKPTVTTKPSTTPPTAKSQTNGSEALISEAQGKRFFAICKGAGMQKEDMKTFLLICYNLESSRLISKPKYEEICTAASHWQPAMTTENTDEDRQKWT